MGFLNINGVSGINCNDTKTQKTDALVYKPKPNSIMTEQKPIGANNQTINDKYKEFDNAVNNSFLGTKFLAENDLLKQGYKKSAMMDMNGGIYYEKNGERVRVVNNRLFGNGKSLTYTTGGVVQVKQQDGSIKVYNYDVDIEGNKFIKSVNISQDDYFADYE